MRLSDGVCIYAGYDAVSAKLSLTQVGCWDHYRRKFKEAQVAQPGKQQGQSKADIAPLKIGKLYKIEREIKGLSAEEKQCQRQKRSLPVLRDHQEMGRQQQRQIPLRDTDRQSAGLHG